MGEGRRWGGEGCALSGLGVCNKLVCLCSTNFCSDSNYCVCFLFSFKFLLWPKLSMIKKTGFCTKLQITLSHSRLFSL